MNYNYTTLVHFFPLYLHFERTLCGIGRFFVSSFCINMWWQFIQQMSHVTATDELELLYNNFICNTIRISTVTRVHYVVQFE